MPSTTSAVVGRYGGMLVPAATRRRVPMPIITNPPPASRALARERGSACVARNGSGTNASSTVAATRKRKKIKGGSAMTPARSAGPDPSAADALPPSDCGAAAAPPAARMARRMPNRIDTTAVPPARLRTASEIAMDLTLQFWLSRSDSCPSLPARGGGSLLLRIAKPAAANIRQIRRTEGMSPWVIALNVAAIALWTTGVFASLYAGYLNPALRVTSSTLSAVVNGMATILIFVFIDPQMSVMTDGT